LCGVIGLISDRPVVQDLLYGMFALQHRGQDAAGVAVFGSTHYVKKGKGLVAQIFDDEIISADGCVGVGHTRYPTAGTNGAHAAHPFVIESSSKIAAVHNGNITNYLDIREALKKRGIFPDSDTDAEMLSKVFAGHYEHSQDVFSAVSSIMETMKGSYSIVIAIDKIGLLAFRDPYGFRPLVLGRKGMSYCFASESVAFESLGFKRIRDVEPGEAVFIDLNLNVVSCKIQERPTAHCMFEWVYFARPDSHIDGRSVYNARLKLGRQLAKRWTTPIDVVIAVPDTARTAAAAFAEAIGVKYREGLIKNRYIGRTFIMPTQSKRESSVRLKLNPIIASVNGRRVAVVDDSIVRGTTSRKIVQMLRDAGAAEVHFISTCPPIKNPCHYGIDFPTRGELIASDKTEDEICKEIGADSLTYQTIADVEISCKKQNLCMACLNGVYPSPISSEQMVMLAEQRIEARKC